MELSRTNTAFLLDLGTVIAFRRLDAGWSTLDLARRTLLPRTLIDRIETGDPEVPIGAYLRVKAAVDHVKMDKARSPGPPPGPGSFGNDHYIPTDFGREPVLGGGDP